LLVAQRLEERMRLEDRDFYRDCVNLVKDLSLTAAIGA